LSPHPRLIVLAVGINNASSTMARQFQVRYQETVALLSRAAPVVVTTITPIRAGAAEGYDATLVPSLNAAIRATKNASSVIDLNDPVSGSDLTTDGVHLGEDGYTRWVKAMVEGINGAIGCAN
jgi:lysophospholipase L1-like esterase